MTEPPVVCLVSCESGAVDTRLLAGTKTDDGTVEGVADRVGLGVFQSKSSDSEVDDGLLGYLTVSRVKSKLTSLFLVTTFSKREASILQSFRFCCIEIP